MSSRTLPFRRAVRDLQVGAQDTPPILRALGLGAAFLLGCGDPAPAPADQGCKLLLVTSGAVEYDSHDETTREGQCKFEDRPTSEGTSREFGPSFQGSSAVQPYVRVLFAQEVSLTQTHTQAPVTVQVQLDGDWYYSSEGTCTADVEPIQCDDPDLSRVLIMNVHCDGDVDGLVLEQLELESGCAEERYLTRP